ncbi:MprA protease, GlyGly-CTERM protein-sorting domain-containing form [Ralstonia pseudosolanacearum]
MAAGALGFQRRKRA